MSRDITRCNTENNNKRNESDNPNMKHISENPFFDREAELK